MQSGEADGQVVALSSLTGTQQALWDQQLVRPLVRFGRVERLASLPDVPTGRELIKDADGLALLEFAELPFFMALPLVAPSGIPDDRAAALRRAFAAMVVDPDFIDDVRKANVELSPIDGAAIAALVAKSAATPRDVIRRYNALLAPPR